MVATITYNVMLTDDGLGVFLGFVEGGHIGIINLEIAFQLVIMGIDAIHDGVVEVSVALAKVVDG